MSKKTYAIFITLAMSVILGVVLPVQAAGWVAQSSGTTQALNGVNFTDYWNGLAVGYNGTILDFISNGWVARNSGVENTLQDVDVYGGSMALVVGDNGTILKTTNGGSTWEPQNSGVTAILYGVKIINSSIAYVVGQWGTILKTTNGGATWLPLTSGTFKDLHDITVSPNSNSVLWAVGKNSIVLYSNNAGFTWNEYAVSTDNRALAAVRSLSSSILLAAGSTGNPADYKISRSIDAGATWSQAASDVAITGFVEDIDMNGLFGFAVGYGSNTFKTSDGGLNWSKINIAPGNNFYGVDVLGAAAVAVGYGGQIMKYDETAPNAPTNLIKTTADSINIPEFTWSAANDDSFGTGIAKYQYSLDGSLSYVNVDIGTSATVTSALSNGPHTISVRAVDKADNNSVSATLSFTIGAPDTTPPTVGAVTQTTATVGSAQTFSAAYSDNVGVTNCWFYVNDALQDGSMNLSNGLASKLYTFTSAGSYSVKVACTDGANDGWGTPVTVVVSAAAGPDTTAPDTIINSKPSLSTVSTSATFGFFANESATFECKLDTGIFAVCTSPKIYDGLSVGSHTFQVRAIDTAGNVDATPDSYTWTITTAPAVAADTVAPSTPSGLQKISNEADATPTFVWNSTSDNVGVTSYLIQIDNGSLIDNGGSTSYTIPSNLSNGSHSFKVLAKDAAGNTSLTSSFTFTVNASAAAVSCPLNTQKAYKSSASKAVFYITADCTKRPFKNGPSFFTYFDSWSEVITTTKTILDSIANDQLGFTPAGPKYDPKYGALVKIVTDQKVYLLLGTEKYWIISESVFIGLKYDWKWIEDVDAGLLDKYSIGSEITYTDHHPNYTIVKYAGFANTYRLEPDPDDYSKQVKRWIKNEKIFNALKFRWDRIVTVPNNETYKDGKVMDESEVNL
ncbi:MAG: hypothetical protein HZC05_02405 [Candidatus Magasanikbacteria bacterium]|nr:hypothetical protein [Candidatus Magasanikbacteria bacterium]